MNLPLGFEQNPPKLQMSRNEDEQRDLPVEVAITNLYKKECSNFNGETSKSQLGFDLDEGNRFGREMEEVWEVRNENMAEIPTLTVL